MAQSPQAPQGAVKKEEEGAPSAKRAKTEMDVEDAGDDADLKPELQKLDNQQRITESMSLMNAQVQEASAALHLICEARVMKRFVQIIASLCKESSLRAETDALFISGIDAGRSCVVECKMHQDDFVKYSSKLSNFPIGIDLAMLQKIFLPFKDQDMVVLCLEKETDDEIKIQGYHTFKRNNEFAFGKVRLMETQHSTIGKGITLEGNDMWNQITMSSQEFTELFHSYKDLTGKHVCVGYMADGSLVISIPDDVDGVSGQTVLRESDTVLMPRKPARDFESTLNAEYICKFGPMGGQINPRVSLFMAENFPFAVSYREAKASSVSFYLIPRVQ